MYLNIHIIIIIILQLQCWVGLECNIIYIYKIRDNPEMVHRY